MSRPNKIFALCRRLGVACVAQQQENIRRKSQAWSPFSSFIWKVVAGWRAKNYQLHFWLNSSHCWPFLISGFFFVIRVLSRSAAFSQEAIWRQPAYSSSCSASGGCRRDGWSLAWVPSSPSPINFLKKGPSVSSQCAGFPSSVIIPSSSSWSRAQVPGRLFSPSGKCKKLSHHFLLHFSIGMGSYDHHAKYQGVFP